jgi:hypothetical protein
MLQGLKIEGIKMKRPYLFTHDVYSMLASALPKPDYDK